MPHLGCVMSFIDRKAWKLLKYMLVHLLIRKKENVGLNFIINIEDEGLDILNERWWNLEKGGSLCPLVIRYKNDNSYEVRN